MKREEIWVIGGDARQAVLAGLLAGDGHRVHGYALEEALRCEDTMEGIEGADCVMLPLPALGGDGMVHTPLSALHLSPRTVLERLRPGQMVLAGRVTPVLASMAEERGLELQDYFAREELTLLNAIPTAEGAIRIAMEALPVTLHGTGTLILGFGRLGHALGPRLAGLGARVTICARSPEQRAMARMLGLDARPLDGLKEWIHEYRLVVNTAPALVLGVEELAAMGENAVVIDLASLPGGVDDETADVLGVRVIHALSLPGKEAPLTAAGYLRDTVYHILEGQE